MDTMDPKKKKIYIAIIVVCILLTGGILFYGFGGSGGPATPDPVMSVPNNQGDDGTVPTPVAGRGSSGANSGSVPQPNAFAPHSAPSVFPADPKFDLTVYQAGTLDEMTDYTPLTVDPSEIGRENPFLKY